MGRAYDITMPRGTLLSDVEKGQIIALQREMIPVRQIAESVGRSVGAVQSFIRRQKLPPRPAKRPNASKISEQQRRALLRKAKQGMHSASELVAELNLPVKKRRVQQILSGDPELRYKKMTCAPLLTDKHREERVKWARRFVSKGEAFWVSTIFSDEKKFCLDGPDGHCHYWHDLRRDPRFFSKRQNGGASLMIWAGLSFYGVTPVVFLSGRQDSQCYCETLSQGLLPFAAETFGQTRIWRLQQDNAPIHTSAHTREWLRSNSISVLPWPARSPDLNIIENLWGILVRRVYARGRQFANVAELQEAIEDSWATIDQELISKLFRSLPRRMLAVIAANGRATKY